MELQWSTRHEVEQPGCIHANMDLYRWAYGAMPWIGSDLLWESFELAIELRVLDMQASPYDLRDFGLEPVRVETDERRVEYRLRQRELAERAGGLRSKLIEALEHLLSSRRVTHEAMIDPLVETEGKQSGGSVENTTLHNGCLAGEIPCPRHES